MASRRKAQECESTTVEVRDGSNHGDTRKQARQKNCWALPSRISLMALKIEFGSMRFLTIYMTLCFSLSLLFLWNNTYPPAQDHIGYPVVDDDQCGSDEERIMNVFEWAKKNGAYIHPRVSTGMFPIPGNDLQLFVSDFHRPRVSNLRLTQRGRTWSGVHVKSPAATRLIKAAGAQAIGRAPWCAGCGRRAR